MAYQQQPVGTSYDQAQTSSQGFDDMFDSATYRFRTGAVLARPAQWPASTSEMRGHVVTSYEGMHEGSSNAIANQAAKKPFVSYGLVNMPSAGKMALGPRSFGGWDSQSSN